MDKAGSEPARENLNCLGVIDLRLRRRVVQSSTPEDGGYRVTFEGCGHTVFFAVHPGRTAHCGACMDELVAEIRQGKYVAPTTPREFLIAYKPKIAVLQQDARNLHAAAFLRKYGISPKEYQQRMHRLRELARGTIAGIDGPESQATMRILLMMWSRANE